MEQKAILVGKIKNLTLKDVFCVVILLILLSIFVLNIIKSITSIRNGAISAELVLRLGSSIGVILAVLYAKKHIDELEKIFVVAGLIIGCCYMLVMTPLAIPDEEFHYQSSYIVSNYMMFKDDKTSATAAHIDYSDLEIHNNVSTAYKRFSDSLFLSEKELSQNKKISDRYGLAYPLQHAPQAIGITIARLCHLNFLGVFYTGRLFNLVFYLLCVYLAIKKIPQFRLPLFTIALFPMSMHQAASYSYDAFVIGLSFLLIALIVKKIIDEDIFSRIDLIEIILVVAFLVPAKVIYVAIAGLMFLIPKERFDGNTKLKIGYISIVILFGIAIFVLFAMSQVTGIVTTSSGDMAEESKMYSLQYIICNPFDTIKIYVKTASVMGITYFKQMIGATLAGLNLNIAKIYWMAFAGIFFVASLQDDIHNYVFSLKGKLWIALIFLGIAFLIMLALLIDWTPIGSNCIQGVQGRYFLPIIPLLVFILRNKIIVLTKDVTAYLVPLILLLQFGVINNIIGFTF